MLQLFKDSTALFKFKTLFFYDELKKTDSLSIRIKLEQILANHEDWPSKRLFCRSEEK